MAGRFATTGAENRTYKRDKNGRFGSGGGSPARLHDDDAEIRKAYDYHDPDTGLTAAVSVIRPGSNGRYTYVEIKVTDSAGNVVGGGERTVWPPDTATVSHSGFSLEPGYQGQGFMTRYNQQAEDVYRENGIRQIGLYAQSGKGLVGGYAWARAGFDFASPMARSDVAHVATSAGSEYSHPVRAQIAKVAANPQSSPIDFAMIGWTPGAKMWPGKEIMMGASWDGVKTL